MAGTTSITTTNANTYAQEYLFQVEMDGVLSAKFKSCSGIKIEVEIAEISQGGDLLPDIQHGKAKISEITLERGAYFGAGGRDFYDLMQRCVDTLTASGEVSENLILTFDIIQINRSGAVVQRHRVNGLIKSYESGDWSDGSDVLIEKIMIQPRRTKLIT